MNKQEQIKSLFRKYVRNQCSREELEKVFIYIKNEEYDVILRDVIEEENWEEIVLPHDRQQIHERVKEKLFKSMRSNSVVMLFCQPGIRTAAAVAGIMLFAALTYFMLAVPQVTTYSTAFGEMKEVVLPDGTVVKMNANSSLSYQNNWLEKGKREVSLKGEAFFKVISTPDKQQFIVHTDEIQVVVLGTEFNVNNRRGKTKVVLQSGKVNVKLPRINDEHFLDPGEMLEYINDKHSFISMPVEVAQYTAWQNKELIFKKASLQEVANALEDQFGLEVIIQEKSLASKNFTGSLPMNDVDVFLKSLSTLFQMEITRSEGIIYFSNKK